MILLIDNYDSFTYNLYQYIGIFNSDIKVVRNDKITIDGTFTKSAEGKIGVDFSGLDAALLIEDGNNVFDLITANALEGLFSSDANDDFEAKNLLNAIADFAWVGNTLTVTFSQVPEPAAVAALIGAFALGVAAWRRRR